MNMKISKNSPQLHFGVTKKDPGLVFHFDVLDLFKSWSKLSLTRIQMSKTNLKKNQKMEKPAHIVCTYRIYVQESYLADLDKVEKNLAQK